ncbi:SDR family NAD(P)-dependent oxidoreductase [Nocardiopsis alba]|uniref:SDR family NAD(P)-dependent oxidoreductase n=1 Tax=Nocardiopsis alba TaxID=53437 RepID=UPI0036C5E208
MLLKDRIAIVHGAGGFVGGAVARTFAEEGARLFLTGRREGRLAAVAEEIGRLGGPEPGIARLDVTDPEEVGRHADSVVSEAGRVDIVFNAVSYGDVQGAPLERMPFDRFAARSRPPWPRSSTLSGPRPGTWRNGAPVWC